MNHLHPGAKWTFRIRAYFVMIFLSFFMGWTIIPIITVFSSVITGSSGVINYSFIGFSIFFYLVLIIVIGEIYSRLSYKNWFYEFEKDGLKLERGIIWKRYSNIPYERIQNVDITRGIFARMLGFSTVMIQTAGYSVQARGAFAEGYIPAVSAAEAEKIRSFIMKKISGKKSKGL